MTKISQLDSANPLSGAEVFPVVQDGETRKATVQEITEFPSSQLASPVGAALVGFVRPEAGAVASPVDRKLLEQAVTPQDFMDAELATKIALRIPTSGDAAAIGAAIQAAVNTGRTVYLPQGTYLIEDAIICDNSGQLIYGEDRWNSIVLVGGEFNLAADGIFVCNAVEPAPEFRNFTILCGQPDTSNRANLIAYPPAIYAVDQPRLRVMGMRIISAITGIDLRGNSGGATIDDLQISSLGWVCRIDGTLDTIRIKSLQHWPFSLSPNQISIFFDTSNNGVESGRCDDLHIDNGLFIAGGKQLAFINTGGGNTFGRVTNTTFDTHAEVVFEDGFMSFGNCFFTQAPTTKTAFKQTGGFARLTGCQFQCNSPLSVPMVLADGNCRQSIQSTTFSLPGDMTAIRAAASAGSADLIVTGNTFLLPANTTFGNYVVDVKAGARATFSNNRASDKGANVGYLLGFEQNNGHVVADNSFTGWGIITPGQMPSASFSGNLSVFPGDFVNDRLVGNEIAVRFISTANSSGNINITHNIPSGNLKVLDARAASRGSGGEWIPCTVAFVDGVQIGVTGAVANARVRVFLTYTETQDAW